MVAALSRCPWLLDSWIHEQLSNNQGGVTSNALSEFKKVLREVKNIIQDNTPCQADKKFKEKGERVYCELTKKKHDATHKSSKTYKSREKLTDFEKDQLGWTEQRDKACWWGGNFEDPNIRLNEDLCLNQAREFLKKAPTKGLWYLFLTLFSLLATGD